MKKLLIFSFSEDPHVQAVCSHLDEIGAKYFIVNTNEIHDKYSFSFCSDSLDYKISNKETGEKIIVDNSWSIWNRRLLKLDLSENLPKGLAKIINDETKRTIEGLMFSHKGRIVNNPRDNYKAKNKLDQLRVAKSIGKGIVVLPTIVSNDPKEIKNFYEQHNGKVCFKLQKGAIVNLKGKNLAVMTNLVNEEHLKNEELLKQCPHLFQEYCDKEYEVRVTGIENEIIGVAIHSQESEISKIDYRRYDFNVPYRKTDLPKNVKNFCHSMLKYYSLHFGAFDFILSKEKDYVFLELNPNGQWLWLEQLAGSKISKVLADYLIS